MPNPNNRQPPESPREAFRARLEAGISRVLPEATAQLQAGPLTPERRDEALGTAGRLLLPDIEKGADELRVALQREVPPRMTSAWSRATNELERFILAAVGFRFLHLPIGRPTSRSVLERLHGRGVVTAWEVVTLIRATLPAGARARSRSLHELAVAADAMVQFGEEVAERYVAHEAIRAGRVFREFARHGEHWEIIPIPKEDLEQAEVEYQRAIDKYGKAFRDDYEWARPALPNRKGRISFADLENAVGGAPWRLKYALASENVHVGDSGGALTGDHGWDNPYLLPRWTTPTRPSHYRGPR